MAGEVARPPSTHQWFDVLGYRFCFRTSSALARSLLAKLYEGFAVPLGSRNNDIYELARNPHSGRWDVRVCRRTCADRRTLEAALHYLEYLLCTRIVQVRRDCLLLHTAVVFAQRGIGLIAGESSAGKSTLALALAARGYRIGSDDVALFDPRSGRTSAVPRCFHLDDRSNRMLSTGARPVPAIKKRHGFITPVDTGRGQPASAAEVHALLCLNGIARPAALAKLAQAQMAAVMLRHSWWHGHSASESLSALSRLSGTASCYALSRGTLHRTAVLASQALGPP
jgi:hypothetical protein